MAIFNTSFGVKFKVKRLEQSPQNFQFCVNIEKEKIWLSARLKVQSFEIPY